jgi:CAI-1 autoinducer synthase
LRNFPLRFAAKAPIFGPANLRWNSGFRFQPTDTFSVGMRADSEGSGLLHIGPAMGDVMFVKETHVEDAIASQCTLSSLQGGEPPADPGFLGSRVDAYYQRIAPWNGKHILKGRQPDANALILFSNDYLALADHPAIIEAQVQALRGTGRGALRSDVFRNGLDDLRRFELELAGLLGTQDVVTCQSGWNANVGLLQSIAGPGTPVYLDMYAHTSLWEGVTSAGADPRPFKHNDPESLERLVARHGPGVVAVDAVYSTSGSICPLEAIVAVAERHGCLLVVDESHSLGVFGAQGEGLTAALGLAERVQFRTSSLSKAFAARGGIVAGSQRHLEYFRYESRPAIFSSGISAPEAAAFLATLQVVRNEPERRERLLANADHLRSRLDALGYNVDDSRCHIMSLVAGPDEATIVLRDALEARGIFGAAFCAPATARNRSLIRFSLTAAFTREQLDRVAGVCGHIAHEVGMADWASTRRKRGLGGPALELSA